MALMDQARKFALEHYASEADLEHPSEVCRLLGSTGAGEDLQAAALLHDLVEDTDVTVDQVQSEFGSEIGHVVAALTEDDSIEDYEASKTEHRTRARDAGRDVALVFVADKLSNARRMRRGEKEMDERKLAHYAATLEVMRSAYPDLPLLDELAEELTELPVDAPG